MLWRNWLPAATLCVGLALRAGAGEEARSPRSDIVSIRLLVTAQANGEIEDCGCLKNKRGGLARRYTFVDSLRRENPNLLVLDAGNFASNAGDSAQARNDLILDVMRRIGYAAWTLGEREFLAGPEAFVGAPVGGARSILTNVSERVPSGRRPIGDRFLLTNVGGVRVGVMGIVDDEVLRKAKVDGRFEAENIYDAAERTAVELTEKGAEVLVLLAQMDVALADSVARRVPEIDVIAMGHPSGKYRATHGFLQNSIVIRTGVKGENAGYLELVVAPSGEIVEFDGRTIPLVERIVENAEIKAMVDEVKAKPAPAGEDPAKPEGLRSAAH